MIDSEYISNVLKCPRCRHAMFADEMYADEMFANNTGLRHMEGPWCMTENRSMSLCVISYCGK